MAPVKTVTCKACGKPINRFLLPDAKDAKRTRRRLERRWKHTGDEQDRRAYHRQFRRANRLINESRRINYADSIADMTAGSKKRWASVSELLYTKDRVAKFSEADALKQCHTISAFCSKISRMNDVIATRLTGTARDPHSHDGPHAGHLLDLLLPVTDDEVMQMISSIPTKSSPMDFCPRWCKRVFVVTF